MSAGDAQVVPAISFGGTISQFVIAGTSALGCNAAEKFPPFPESRSSILPGYDVQLHCILH